MKAYLRLSAVVAVLALSIPAIAFATPGNGKGKGQGHGQGQEQGQGPNYTPASSPPEQAKAYGRYCQGESKKHVKGEKGTAFSRCVTNMAHAAEHPSQAPAKVCQGESKKHVKGEKGTAYSRCVKSTAHLRRDERRKEREEQQSS